MLLVDYLTVHTPLTDETKADRRQRDPAMQRGVRLICARGGITTKRLVEGLKSGQLGGALDVLPASRARRAAVRPARRAVRRLNVSTEEAQTQVAERGRAAGRLFDHRRSSAVNMSNVDPAKLAALRGYLDPYRLGLLLAQLDHRPPRSCRLVSRRSGRQGHQTAGGLRAGLLANAPEENINIVNAESLLKERGIELVEQSRTDMAFSSTSSRAGHRSGQLQGRQHDFRP
jgi:D-3-phosphoglycerate dehydrogenase